MTQIKGGKANDLQNLALGAAAGGLLGNSWQSAGTGALVGYGLGRLANKQPLIGGRGCTRQTNKKYTSRGSPPYPANECRGSTMRGNDGMTYKSVEDSNGIHRWQKFYKSKGTIRDDYDHRGKRTTPFRSRSRRSVKRRSVKRSRSTKRSVKRRSSSRSPRSTKRSNYKMTLTNRKPAGAGWKSDGTGYDLILNRREYFWSR